MVRPQLAIADPEAMTGLAERALRASAMNALAHGADSLYTPFANPVSRMTALRGAELLAAALDEERPERNRAALAQGSLLCAYAIDSAAFGLHHVICQTLVRICGTPHAETNAAILPRAIAFMTPRALDQLSSLAEAIGTDRRESNPASRSWRQPSRPGGARRRSFEAEPSSRLDAVAARAGVSRPNRPLARRPLVAACTSAGAPGRPRRPSCPCSARRDRVTPPGLPRLHPPPQRQLAAVPAGPGLHDPLLPRLLPPRPHRPRVRAGRRRADRRRQPPQLPRPLRDRRRAALAAADELRRQGRAVRAPLAGLAALAARRLPDPPRRVGRAGDGDRPPGGRAGRHRLHVPRGHADPPRHPGGAEARRRPAGAADRRARPADRRLRLRARAPRLAHPPAPGAGAARQGDDLPAGRAADRAVWPSR